MRDEIEGRLWAEHQQEFAQSVDQHIAVIRGALARLASWDGTTAHLVSLVGAFLLTAFTFNATAI